jgi:hypothetical protein
MLMESEEDKNAATVPTSSPSSSTFRPQDNSSLVFTGGATSTSPHEPVEVSSLNISLSPIAYDDNHGLCLGDLDTIFNLDGLMTQEAHQEQARRQNGHESRGAFRPYVRHLSPRKKPKPGACGQRAIKAAMSASARMHMTRLALAHWQSVRMNMAAEPSVENSSYNQAQHVLSERKRREKLNDNFKALRTVLPPGIKVYHLTISDRWLNSQSSFHEQFLTELFSDMAERQDVHTDQSEGLCEHSQVQSVGAGGEEQSAGRIRAPRWQQL